MIGTRELAKIYAIRELNLPELRDPDDTIVLATAIASQADAIITGDSLRDASRTRFTGFRRGSGDSDNDR